MAEKSLMSTYSRLPVAFSRGEGAWLWDSDGKRYLDAVAGVAVCSLGHAHPAIAKTLAQQASRLIHTSNLYQIPLQEELGQALIDRTTMARCFFGNSGAEANEAAIKLARLYGHQKGIEKPHIVVMEQSFHGRTLATLSATGNRKIQAGFEPLVSGFLRVPFDDIAAVNQVAASRQDVVAVLVEPVQGEGGVRIPGADYLTQLRGICDRRGWLLMLDEIQTGMCRTGQWFAWQHENVRPDVMTLAKALGNGVPVGACLARGDAAEVLVPGSHGSTYGGNPLACASALTTIEIMSQQQLELSAEAIGKQLARGFQQALGDNPGVVDIRERGAMIGLELDRPCGELVTQALQQGLLINVTAGNVVRLLPPLIMDTQQVNQVIETLVPLITGFLTE
ncbi:MAG: aspartate aminotransferase family protein [Gammaproteobacteria bacterium]|nr:aspartate aminotransferase family protein [Gammaproteobacteria bacterium]